MFRLPCQRAVQQIAQVARVHGRGVSSTQRVCGQSAGYPGAEEAEFTTEFAYVDPETVFPMYQVMGPDGKFVEGANVPDIAEDKDAVLKMYKVMTTTQVMDTFMYKRQRQGGSLSFWMQNHGEEGTHVGSAAALTEDDIIFAQYREVGVLLWRGFTLDEAMAQCFSTQADKGKGRQMPVHYGSSRLNFQTISSPLSTQIPQAAGAGYALKREGKDAIAIAYFGDGAASEGDFHSALNFAATLDSPTMFFCRNNGYAISTPTKEQYRGDGIAARGPGYGIPTIRVDGNDVFSVYDAVKRGRELCVSSSRPVLIEAMTYRGGDHSSSDDSSRYRPTEERERYGATAPIPRLRAYITDKGWWSDEDDKALQDAMFDKVMSAMRTAQSDSKPALNELFTDVYDDIPPHIEEQRDAMHAHLAKYGHHYDLDQFAK